MPDMKQAVFILFATGLFLSSCYKDNFEKLHPKAPLTGSCDTTIAISYSAQIAPIINNYCISCHGAGQTLPDLSTYTGVKASAQSNLYSSVSWDGSVPQMPKGSSSRIPVCDLSKIRLWIAAGAANN